MKRKEKVICKLVDKWSIMCFSCLEDMWMNLFVKRGSYVHKLFENRKGTFTFKEYGTLKCSRRDAMHVEETAQPSVEKGLRVFSSKNHRIQVPTWLEVFLT